MRKSKKQKRQTIIITISVLAVLVVAILLLRVLWTDGMGYTSEKAAGSMGNYECIQTKDYDIYYYSIREDMKPGICGFTPVKKTLFWYEMEKDSKIKGVFAGEEYVGVLYILEGKNEYCNILVLTYMNGKLPEYVYEFDTVTVDGKEIDVEVNSLFVTDKEIEEFYIDGNLMTLKESP